jgi:glycerol-3-phosphate dehydrogenase
MKAIILLCLTIACLLGIAHAEEVVFNVLPESKVTSTDKETSRELLNQSKRNEFRLLMTKTGTNYVWAARPLDPYAISRST